MIIFSKKTCIIMSPNFFCQTSSLRNLARDGRGKDIMALVRNSKPGNVERKKIIKVLQRPPPPWARPLHWGQSQNWKYSFVLFPELFKQRQRNLHKFPTISAWKAKLESLRSFSNSLWLDFWSSGSEKVANLIFTQINVTYSYNNSWYCGDLL